MNTLKTVFLMTLIMVLFLFAGYLLGGKTGMTIALVFSLIMNFGSYWFSDKIVLKMYRAQQVTRENAPKFYNLVEQLSQKASLPMPKVYIINDQPPNAFATGRNPQNAAVAATTGILQGLNNEELGGVIAHELSHIKNRDILTGTIAATLIQLANSRSREFAADEGVANITGNPLSLASALSKISLVNEIKSIDHVNPSTAHMFIVNPLKGGGIAKLFSTHPSVEERIKRLEEIGSGRR